MTAKVVTVEAVRAFVAVVEDSKGDYEIAHSFEDALHSMVLEAIAGGAPNPAELAAEALKTSDIEFRRYCA